MIYYIPRLTSRNLESQYAQMVESMDCCFIGPNCCLCRKQHKDRGGSSLFGRVYALLGNEITGGLELAFEQYGSEFGGRKIILIKEDSEVRPKVGLSKTKKLVFQDKVDLLVGPVASNVAGAMRDFVHNVKVPLIIPNAGNNLLTGEKCSPWVIRTSFSNDQINRSMGPWLFNKGFRTLFLMAPDYAAGHQMMDAVRGGFEEAGGTVVGLSLIHI